MLCCSYHIPEFSGGCMESPPTPYYPIQTMCEQANYCTEKGDVHRLGELHRSAQYHRSRYKDHEYAFILEHLQNVLDAIKDETRKVNAMKKLNSD